MEPFGDPLFVVVSKEEVDALDIAPALSTLKRLISSPAVARANMEMVDISFFGYDNRREELFEIPSVREYVHLLDEEFPFWLFFLSKHFLGLQCLTLCFLLPFLTDEGKTKRHPQQLQELLLKRWFPAMNQVSTFAGLSEEEIEGVTNRAMDYFTRGPRRGV